MPTWPNRVATSHFDPKPTFAPQRQSLRRTSGYAGRSSAQMSNRTELKRELGLFGATMMGLGAMVGTGVFVSIGIAAGVAGPSVILAIALAAVVATCNALSSAQLAASMPV